MLIFPGTQGILLSVSLVSSFLHKQHLDLKKERERRKGSTGIRVGLLNTRTVLAIEAAIEKDHTCIKLLHFL